LKYSLYHIFGFHFSGFCINEVDFNKK